MNPILIHRTLFRRGIQKEYLPAAIIGKPECARRMLRAISKESKPDQKDFRELRILAVFVDGAPQWQEAREMGVVVSETYLAQEVIDRCGIQHGVLALPEKCDRETQQLFENAAQVFKYLFVAPRHVSEDCPPIWTQNAFVGWQTGLPKRLLDLLGAVVLCALTFPVIALSAVVVRCSSSGPILYKQGRIGRGNRAFTALKFRTMWNNADEKLNHHLASDPALRLQWESLNKLKNDPRVTPVGRLLRRFSLDELPQLWNVLRGDMSLIGPRPIVLTEIEKYGAHYAVYQRVRPGLTGLWQVSGRSNTTYQQRVAYDSYYVHNWSLWLDAKILFRTVRAVISAVGAY